MFDHTGRLFRHSLAVSMEPLSPSVPVLLRGDIYQIIRDAQGMGYDAVELHLRNATRVDGEALRSWGEQHGIAVSALATGLEASINGCSMVSENPKVRARTMRQLKEHVDLAEKLHCLVVIGVVRGNITGDRDAQLGVFREGLAEITSYAVAKGVTVALEAINLYVNNYLNTLRETCDFIRSFGMDNLKLHIDTHHMNVEDYDPVDSVLYCGDNIGYVHVSEINRMYPGAGRMDFPGLIAALRRTGYRGYLALECIPKPDGHTAAKKGLDYLKTIELR